MNCRALAAAFAFGCLSLAPSPVRADNAKRQCLLAAQEEFIICREACQDTRDLDKVVCGVNPECKKGCASDYEACREPFQNVFKDCKDACGAAFDVGSDSCKASTNCGSKCGKDAAYLACRLPFAVAEFACKQTCRDNKKTDTTTRDGLKACNQTLKACVKACNNATPVPTPTATPVP